MKFSNELLPDTCPAIDGPGIESRGRGGARFFAHVQTGPGAHPASCTIGTGSFPGVKRPRRGADHPPLLAPRLRISTAIPLLPSRPLVACYRVNIFLLVRQFHIL
jgi:hypothetical protein